MSDTRKVDPESGETLYAVSYKGELKWWPAKEINIVDDPMHGRPRAIPIFDLPEGYKVMEVLGAEYEFLIAQVL